MEDYLSADCVLDLIDYCIFVQKMGKFSMEWAQEQSDSAERCPVLEA